MLKQGVQLMLSKMSITVEARCPVSVEARVSS